LLAAAAAARQLSLFLSLAPFKIERFAAEEMKFLPVAEEKMSLAVIA